MKLVRTVYSADSNLDFNTNWKIGCRRHSEGKLAPCGKRALRDGIGLSVYVLDIVLMVPVGWVNTVSRQREGCCYAEMVK